MIKRALTSSWRFIDDRIGISETIGPMMKHIVPRDARWWYVFGSAALCAFIIQVLTGIGLAMAYVPAGAEAYQSLQYLTHDTILGRIMRGMHFYGASAMVMLVVLHMCQVYLHATYKYPREMNWMSGVVLLLFVLAMGFTGQLLRWDANGVWSVVVGAEMAGRAPLVGPAIARFILGGETVGGATLSRFFVIHVFVLPACIFAGIGLHLYLVLRHGISEMPKPGEPVVPATYKRDYEARLKKTGVPFWPNAAWRDSIFALLVTIAIIACAILFGAPELGNPPDPTTLDVNPSPDWYFKFYFAILSLLPASLETWIILGLPVVVFGGLLALPLFSNKGERAPSKRPWAVAILVFAFVSWVVLTIYGFKAPWSPHFGARPLPESVVGASSGPVFEGSRIFFNKGCLYCHDIAGHGGHRGPELTRIGELLTRDQLIIRINNGGTNMPAFAGNITRKQLDELVAFLQSRRASGTTQPTNPSTAKAR